MQSVFVLNPNMPLTTQKQKTKRKKKIFFRNFQMAVTRLISVRTTSNYAICIRIEPEHAPNYSELKYKKKKKNFLTNFQMAVTRLISVRTTSNYAICIRIEAQHCPNYSGLKYKNKKKNYF